MDHLYQRTVGKDRPLTLLTIEKGEVSSNNVILEFARSHMQNSTIAVFTNEASELATIFASNSINISTNIDEGVKRGQIYILPLNKSFKGAFENAIFYLLEDIEKEDINSYAQNDKLIVSATETNMLYDSIIFDSQDEVLHGYYIFKHGYYQTATRFFKELFKKDESSISKIFVNPVFLRDGLFIGFIIKIETFSYSYLYETFRYTKIRDVILKFIDKYMDKLFEEIQNQSKFHLVPTLLRDYNYELVLAKCDEKNVMIFNYLTDVEKEELYKNIRGSEKALECALRLRALSYSHIYQSILQKGLNFGLGILERNLEGLLKEIDFNSNITLLYQAFDDFDNQKIIEIASANQMRIFHNIDRDKGHDIYLNVYANTRILELGESLHMWTYLDVYRFFSSSRVPDPTVQAFLETKLDTLISEINDLQSVEMVRNLFNNFGYEKILMKDPKLLTFLPVDDNHDIFEKVFDNNEVIQHCLDEHTWNSIDIYRWYTEIDKENPIIVKYLEGRLSRLVERIDNERDLQLLNRLANDFNADLLIETFKTLRITSTVQISKENCEKIFDKCTKTEENLNDGIRLKLWTSTDAYVYISTQPNREKLLPAIGKNLEGLVVDICTRYKEAFRNVLADFDNALVMDEFFRANIEFPIALEFSEIEKMITECSVNQKLIAKIFEWAIVPLPTIVDIAKNKDLNLSVFFALHIADIVGEIEDNDYLAKIAIISGREDEVCAILKRKFKLARAKAVRVLMTTLKEEGKYVKDPLVDEALAAPEPVEEKKFYGAIHGEEVSVERNIDKFATIKEGFDGGITADDLINLLNNNK